MKYPIESEEKRTINRITFRQSFNDFLNAFNVERGLIYTLRNLFTNPGELIRNYLGEGRHKVVNPFRLLILTTAVSLLVMYISDFQSVFNEMEGALNEGVDFNKTGNINEIMLDWYNLFLWISIPIFAFCTLILNRKHDYNYAENIVLQTYYISAMNLLTTLLMSMNLFIDIFSVLVVIFIANTILYFYMVSSFYQRKSIVFLIKNLFGYLIAYSIYSFVMTTILGAIMYVN
ncbi:Protein of unknown function [Ekhidna lutea]|uniref:Yip1 domain-containing protein n=1 Tax=Ekhidna lutea TaxID=447679 RepID=A0A239JJV4_EKHLU|nr:DUF3667 domain-containing protein [Ekhidna lutea]SNT05603.1 Protein of unknown function [Ekhidna lutea]